MNVSANVSIWACMCMGLVYMYIHVGVSISVCVWANMYAHECVYSGIKKIAK